MVAKFLIQVLADDNSGQVLTDGGRVLSIVCQEKDFDKVFEKVYKNLKEINFEGYI